MRKSAVQKYWITASMIAISPNVASSELSGDTEKRDSSHCTATPSTKNSGTISTSVASGSMPAAPTSW